MKTTKPISTISYNTDEFLHLTLERLVKNHMISFGCYITHQPEDDEGDKVHKHLFIIPSKMTQTDELRDIFKELDPSNISRPLGVMPFANSKWDDWYLYAIHDRDYLAGKLQRRKFSYKKSDIWSTEPDYMDELIRGISMVRVNSITRMRDLQSSGWTWKQYVMSGAVPLQQMKAYSEAWQFVQECLNTGAETFRNGRANHEEMPDGVEIDETTGEVLKMP